MPGSITGDSYVGRGWLPAVMSSAWGFTLVASRETPLALRRLTSATLGRLRCDTTPFVSRTCCRGSVLPVVAGINRGALYSLRR